MATEPIGVGVAGLGAFGQFTAAIYAAMPAARIVALASGDPAKRATLAARYGATGYPDFPALLADPLVEVVVLNTPPHRHAAESLAALNAGKHVFIEKPLATELAGAERIVTVARERGLQISVNYVERHAELHTILRAVVASGLLGGVTAISLENYASNDGLHDQHWFWDQARSGGIFVEHGVHFFDLANQIAGCDPVAVAGFTSTEPNGRQDRVMAAVHYASGALATFYHAFDRPGVIERTALRVTLEQGALTAYGWIPTRLEVEGAASPDRYPALETILGVPVAVVQAPAPPGVPGGTPGEIARATVTRPDKQTEYQAAVRRCFGDFLRAIRDPAHPAQVTAADALLSARVAFAARASARQGSRIARL